MKDRRSWTDDQLTQAVKISISKAQVLRSLGLSQRPGNYSTIDKYICKLGLDISHFTGKGHGTTIPKTKFLDEEVFVTNSFYSRASLKIRLFKDNLKQRRCELCGQGEDWHGKKMSLILDHINGINNDNRIENLRIVCPNCNATLPTFCGKAQKRHKQLFFCACGNKKDRQAQNCKNCACLKSRKVLRPTKEELEKMLWEMPSTKIGKLFSVSEKAVEKWAKVYKIPKPSRGYWQKQKARRREQSSNL